MGTIYGGLAHARRWLASQVPDRDRQDNLLLLISALAAVGVAAIQFFWGLPA